jgi:hypothetical protein
LIKQFGFFVSFLDTFNYILGSDKTLTIEDNGSGCAVKVNGEECSKCEIVDCQQEASEPGVNYVIDCSNVLLCEASYECGEGDEIFGKVLLKFTPPQMFKTWGNI